MTYICPVENNKRYLFSELVQYAMVVELVDTRDLKSLGQ